MKEFSRQELQNQIVELLVNSSDDVFAEKASELLQQSIVATLYDTFEARRIVKVHYTLELTKELEVPLESEDLEAEVYEHEEIDDLEHMLELEGWDYSTIGVEVKEIDS
jgi:predicted nucleotidyltransferase component of viral defense system